MPWKLAAAGVTTVAACLVAAQVKLGEPAPDVPLHDPAGRSLKDLHGRKVVLLGIGADPAGFSLAAQELRQRGIEVARANLPGAVCDFWLVDEDGVVRGVDALPQRAEGIVEFVNEWELGKKSFEWGCKNCHGQNGRETYYYGVKSLGGIGNRLSRDKIQSTLNATMIAPGRYSIRCFHFSARELKALVTYVAGL
jgi:hypothetical protein